MVPIENQYDLALSSLGIKKSFVMKLISLKSLIFYRPDKNEIYSAYLEGLEISSMILKNVII